MDCVIDNNLEVLIISGTATPEQLQSQWDRLYVEYCGLSQDGTYNELFELAKEINGLRAKMYLVDGIVEHLQYKFDEVLVNILNELALRCNITVTDNGADLEKKLNAVVGRAKKWSIQLKTAEANLEKVREKNTTKIDRNYFYDQLQVIGEFNKYHVKAADLTVGEYCRIIVNIQKQIERESMKKQLTK